MSFRSRSTFKLLVTGAVSAGLIAANRMTLADGTPLFSFKPKPVASSKPGVSNGTAAPKTAGVPSNTASQAAEPPRLLDDGGALPIMPQPTSSASRLPTRVPGEIQTVAGTDGSKSDVMRQLELLYQQDGRQMPDLQVMQPVPSEAVRAANAGQQSEGGAVSGQGGATPASRPSNATGNASPAQGGYQNQSFQPRTNYTQPSMTQPTPPVRGGLAAPAPIGPSPVPQEQPAANKGGVAGFFKKLIPGKKDKEPASTPAPTGYRPDQAPVPPITSAPQSTQPNYRPFTPPPQTINGNGAQIGQGGQRPTLSNSTITSTPSSQGTRTNAAVPALELSPVTNSNAARSSFDIPPAPGGDFVLPLPSGTTTADVSLPPLLTLPQPTGSTPTQKGDEESKSIATVPGDEAFKLPRKSSDSLDDVFTEMSEEEADEEEMEEQEESGPFTGVTLDEDDDSAKTRSGVGLELPNVSATTKAAPKEDPFAEELKKLGILPSTSDSSKSGEEKSKALRNEEPTETKTASSPAEQPTLMPPAASSSFDHIEDASTREKMQKIQERGGMKGLKGFCPVTLHDQRDLVDAKAEFHATFRGQKFHFASADARETFLNDPSHYAPAAYGADVVALTRDKDVVEGTLDFAAWFKGRLYLFGSQESHDEFVKNPVQYATPAGIE